MREKVINQLLRLAYACLLMFGVSALVPPPLAQAQDEGSRQIVAEEFTRNRIKPPTNSSGRRADGALTGKRARPANASVGSTPQPRYKRVIPTPAQKASPSSSVAPSSAAAPLAEGPLTTASKVGVTIWRLRPAKPSDSGGRILVQENAKETQWTAQRVGAEMELRVSDRVRLSIESPREGYLYVVDRELYADGTMGDPYLIFPTSRTRDGDNRVQPGKLIDIPGQEDNPNYFTLVPSPSREDQVAEVLSVIVTTEPLENFEMTDKPAKLSKSQVEKWEKQWSTRVEQYELEGGAGQTWSKQEKDAGAEGTGRYLTQDDPSPQTIYLVEGKNNRGLLVNVPLRYKR